MAGIASISDGIEGNIGHNEQNLSKVKKGGMDEFHDDVLINILSHTSLKESARASVLARRWRYLWRFSYKTLRFDHMDSATGNVMDRRKFRSWVNTVVKLHQAPYIEGMVIRFKAKGNRNTFSAVDSWVFFAMQKEVERFELIFLDSSFTDKAYLFPTVERLISQYHVVTSSPFRRLRTLRLAEVDVEDDVVHYFLASCPNLEHLCIQYSYVTHNLRVTDPPCLKVLEVTGCMNIVSMEVSAVNLLSLTYRGMRNILVLKKIPNLRELTVNGEFCKSFAIEPKEHWSYSVNLEKLVLDFDLMNSNIVGPIDLHQLCSLKQLEVRVFTDADHDLRVFTSFLNACPQSCKFWVELNYFTYPDNFLITGTSFMADVKFVRENPKVIEVAGFLGCPNEEKLLLALLEMSPSVERVVIDTESDYYDHGETTRDEAVRHAERLLSKFPLLRIQSTVR